MTSSVYYSISIFSPTVSSNELKLIFSVFFQAEDGIRYRDVTGVQTCALPICGLLKYIHGGEDHAYNPDVIQSLQIAVKSGKYTDYRVYADQINTRAPIALRDLLALNATNCKAISIDEVEPLTEKIGRASCRERV